MPLPMLPLPVGHASTFLHRRSPEPPSKPPPFSSSSRPPAYHFKPPTPPEAKPPGRLLPSDRVPSSSHPRSPAVENGKSCRKPVACPSHHCPPASPLSVPPLPVDRDDLQSTPMAVGHVLRRRPLFPPLSHRESERRQVFAAAPSSSAIDHRNPPQAAGREDAEKEVMAKFSMAVPFPLPLLLSTFMAMPVHAANPSSPRHPLAIGLTPMSGRWSTIVKPDPSFFWAEVGNGCRLQFGNAKIKRVEQGTLSPAQPTDKHAGDQGKGHRKGEELRAAVGRRWADERPSLSVAWPRGTLRRSL